MQSWVACDIKTEFQTRFEKKYVCSKGLYWPSHNVWCFPYNKIDRQIDVTVILFLLVQNRQQIHDWLDPGANELGIQEWKVNQLNLKDLNQAKDRDYLLEQNQKKVRGFKKKFVDFRNFLKIEFVGGNFLKCRLFINLPFGHARPNTKFAPNRFSRFDVH